MIILQKSPSIIVINLYMLSIQTAPLITVTMLLAINVVKLLLQSLTLIEGGLYVRPSVWVARASHFKPWV